MNKLLGTIFFACLMAVVWGMWTTLANAAPVTVGSDCAFAWDYPTTEQVKIDGFRLYLDDKVQNTAAPTDRQMYCKPMAPGVVHTATLVAFNAKGESPRSAAVEVFLPVAGPVIPPPQEIQLPVAPTGFRTVVTISVVPAP
jgi:hypothetical protein